MSALNEISHGFVPSHFVVYAVMELLKHSPLKIHYVWQVLSSPQHRLLLTGRQREQVKLSCTRKFINNYALLAGGILSVLEIFSSVVACTL